MVYDPRYPYVVPEDGQDWEAPPAALVYALKLLVREYGTAAVFDVARRLDRVVR